MEPELESRPPDDVWAWRRSLTALAVLIALVVAAQLWGAEKRRDGAGTASVEKSQALVSGDFYIRLDQAKPSGTATAAALRNYRKAVPWPSAYRRLGVMKESYGESGLADFRALDSPRATRDLSKKEIVRLREEKTMWLRVFGPKKLTRGEAAGYVKRIKSLNLGPLKDAAQAQVYWRSGQHDKFHDIRRDSRNSARWYLAGLFSLLGVLVLGGLTGLMGAVLFLIRNASRFAAASRAPLQSSMLLTAFIVYLASYIGLSGMTEALADAAGVGSGKWSGLVFITLVIASALAAFGLGMLSLVGRAKILAQDWREVGFRTAAPLRDIAFGVAGFFGSLPFVFALAIIAAALNRTVFRHFPTPEQPFDQIVSTGGALEIALVFFAGSVVAPIVEEAFFRGVLYSAFRTRMDVWPSVLVTSSVFALIHPLPGGFLPIFALACVLALLRERSGSILPGIVCHAVYNAVVLLIASLL